MTNVADPSKSTASRPKRPPSIQDRTKSDFSQKKSLFQLSNTDKFGIKKKRQVILSTGISKEEKLKI